MSFPGVTVLPVFTDRQNDLAIAASQGGDCVNSQNESRQGRKRSRRTSYQTYRSGYDAEPPAHAHPTGQLGLLILLLIYTVRLLVTLLVRPVT